MGAFEKLQAPQENTAIQTNIERLQSIQNKKELYKQALKVSEELNSKNDYTGTFEFVEKNGQLYLKTYGQETGIDLEKKSIGNISLYTTYQTLKAANLTNRLKDLFQ
jgi:hypothetical protein